MRHSITYFPIPTSVGPKTLGIHPTDRNGKPAPFTKQSDWYCNCIFCGHKGKMNINLVKNAFYCNYCGANGGMLDLYGDYYHISRKEAYDEICKELHLTNEAPVSEKTVTTACAEQKALVETPDRASDKEINRTYSMLLSMLSLSDKHYEDLKRRGLTDLQIKERRYKSTPVFGFHNLIDRLQEQGCTLKGVPGFYEDAKGRWTMNFSPKGSGFLIPMESIDGFICGMQIRLDHPKGSQKYIWFSSSNKKNGTGSGSPIHWIGNPDAEVIWLTEGGLKGTIAHYMTGYSFLCVPGVNHYKNLEAALIKLKEKKLKTVHEAFDMDKMMQVVTDPLKCPPCERRTDCKAYLAYQKLSPEIRESMVEMNCPHKEQKRGIIQKACMRVYEICERLELSCVRRVWDLNENGEWNGNYKGIDDYHYEIRKKV